LVIKSIRKLTKKQKIVTENKNNVNAATESKSCQKPILNRIGDLQDGLQKGEEKRQRTSKEFKMKPSIGLPYLAAF
jgi:hypothetical protein